jgi:nicotinate-nucleotide adenylyltransferase
VDTVRELRRLDPTTELFVLLGVDQWRELASWKEPSELARLATLGVMAREGENPRAVDPGVGVACRPVPVPRIDLSSSEVRARIRDGRSIRYLVPPSVERIVRANALYGSPRLLDERRSIAGFAVDR